MNILKILKNNIRKYIRKYISVACSLLLIFIFSVDCFAVSEEVTFAVEVHNYDEDSYIKYGSSAVQIDTSEDKTPQLYFDVVIPRSALNGYSNGYYDFMFVIHKTFAGTFTCNMTFYDYQNNVLFEQSGTRNSSAQSSTTMFLSTATYTGESYKIGRVRFEMTWPTQTSAYSETILMTLSRVGVTDDGSTESIIAAINSQTSSLGGKLDGIDSGIDKGNDLIENGNEDTQSALTDFNEVFEDFNNELDSLEQFDDDIIGEFNAANDNYKTELNNFNLAGSLLDASTWLSTSMQTVYDNSSDFKMLWLVPLLFGIPILLFVIKKDKEDN